MTRQPIRYGVHRTNTALVAAVLAASLMIFGCSRDGEESSAEDSRLPYPASLDADSTPSDVAAVLIQALEKDDSQTLLGLVAAEVEAKNMNKIFRRHGREGEVTAPKAAALAAAGWGASYSFFRAGETEVRRHEIDGDKAEVFARGISRGGPPRTLKISMIRVDGVWKVLAGLKNLPE